MDVSAACTVLHVGPASSATDVRRAYHAQLRRVHPDTGSGDVDAFNRVRTAYAALAHRPHADGLAPESRPPLVDVYA